MARRHKKTAGRLYNMGNLGLNAGSGKKRKALRRRTKKKGTPASWGWGLEPERVVEKELGTSVFWGKGQKKKIKNGKGEKTLKPFCSRKKGDPVWVKLKLTNWNYIVQKKKSEVSIGYRAREKGGWGSHKICWGLSEDLKPHFGTEFIS